MTRQLRIGFAAALMTLAAVPAADAQLRVIRIGDVDGTGLGDGAGLLNFEGDPVNVDGAGVLAPGDFLPDWNQDGDVMHFSGDDFDLRSPAEILGASVSTIGFVDVASTGAQYTDLTLSLSYDTTFGTPNDFPSPPSTDRNNSVFRFEFTIDVDAIDPCTEVFFNIVFADIGGGAVSDLEVTFTDGTMLTEAIPPINPNVEDGLIVASFLELDFDLVFTRNGSVYDGFIIAELVTLPGQQGGDPYYTVDFAELSTVTVESCFGDIDFNGVVDVDDVLQVLAAWGPCNDPCLPACRADIVENLVIDVDDLLAVLGAWGPCNP